MIFGRDVKYRFAIVFVILAVVGCSRQLPPPPQTVAPVFGTTDEYRIGTLDQLEVFVWRSAELSSAVPVRPDGRISLPLIGEIEASGKTVGELGDEITQALRVYVQNPVVSVIVTNFGTTDGQSISVVGEVDSPVSVPYRAGMTVLDVMVAVGGLSEFAAGDDAVLIRGKGEDETLYGLNLDRLLNDGDLKSNAPVLPGDVILIPKSYL